MLRTLNKGMHYPMLKLNDTVIERVDKFKFFGIWLDEYLNWGAHIDHVCLKISRMNGTLNRLKHHCPQTVLMILYNTLILPHINYGILLWGAKVNNDYKMHLLQKKSVKLIASKHYMAHSEPIFKDLRILMIHDIYYLSIVKSYYKLTNGHLLDYFDHFKPKVSTGCSRYPIRDPTI